MENIVSEAEEAAKRQHMKTLYGLTKHSAMKDLGRVQQYWTRMETLSVEKMKCSQDGQSTLRKCLRTRKLNN